MNEEKKQNDKTTQITGEIVSVIFQSEDTGYTVLKVNSSDGETITIVGCLPLSAPGESIIATGAWVAHPQHGRQFAAEYVTRHMPVGADAIYEYLSAKTVKGIGPATALLLVQKFGDETLDVLENHPERLYDIRGLSQKKAREISADFKKRTGLRRLIEFLQEHRLKPKLAMQLYRVFGETALDTLRQNPYIIVSDRIGARFSEADDLALSMSFERDCIERIEAAICFELRHNSKNGHCFIPADKLIEATAELLESDVQPVADALEFLEESYEIVKDDVAGVSGVYLRRMFEAERGAAERLASMLKSPSELNIDTSKHIASLEKEFGITYAEYQRDTIALAAKERLLVITGGPGTGKTTCIRAIAALLLLADQKITLAAPTGRAAKRMNELTGQPAQTVHRLLGAGYNAESDETVFSKCAGDPLDCDCVILDECSMVDITLFSALLDAMPESCRLIMVGDADQLPSVGPGNVFSDIIRSEAAPVVRLTEIFRQTSMSRIVLNAHMVNKGEYIDLKDNSGDFFFMRRIDPAKAVDTIAELCARRLPESMNIPSREIQVLSPTRRSETGTKNLNLRLQAILNPPGKAKKERKFGEIIFREGDKIMQIRNNYDIIWQRGESGEFGSGIFNGDIGFITRYDEGEDLLYVDFDERIAAYSPDMLLELEHAFAMTVHKSQGSEYRAVVLSLSKGTPMLLSRGVLYTAITRARELLVAVGDEGSIYSMIDNFRQVRRYSGLRARLCALITSGG